MEQSFAPFSEPTAARAFAALGHAGRLAVFAHLMRHAPRGTRPTQIAQALGMKQNSLSHYLFDLEAAGLVVSMRAGRGLTYRVATAQVGGLMGFLWQDCCLGRPDLCLPQPEPLPDLPSVLFLCTANSARSLIAEALMRDLGVPRFAAYSAGSAPATAPAPEALELLARYGHSTQVLVSKGFSALPEGLQPAYIFTLCDRAAEACLPARAFWRGHPVSGHWGLPDPMQAEDRPRALAATYATLHQRLSALIALPPLPPSHLQARVDALAELI